MVARAGFAPAFRGYEPLVLSYATTAPQLLKNWSGWQELNLRGHVPKTCGWPLPYTRIMGEGLLALSLFIPSRRPPGATCVPRPPDRAALPSPRQWTCTPSEFRRSHHAAVPVRANPVEGEQHRHGTIPYPGRAHRNHGRELGQQEYVASHRWPASPTLQRARSAISPAAF